MAIKSVAPGLAWLALAISIPLAAQQAPPLQGSSTEQAQSGTQPSATQSTSAQPPQSPPAAPPVTEQDKKEKGKDEGSSKDRLFYALPNFLTVQNAGQIKPLTSGQKFHVVFRGAFDYVQFPWYGLLAGIGQAENSEPAYGQGWGGYAKRYGTNFADGTIENFMVGAVLPSLLHQDPRFFQSSEGSFVHRAGYAVSRMFIIRTDSGRSQFNYSEIVGGALSASISTFSYHPRSFTTVRVNSDGTRTFVHNASDRTLVNAASVWGSQLGYDTITIVVKEFWPDVQRKLSHKHREAAPDAPAH